MRYGDNKTIHRTGHVDVETDKNGKVVAVWFRCAMLPFEQHTAGDDRADDMDAAYKDHKKPEIQAIIFKDEEEVKETV